MKSVRRQRGKILTREAEYVQFGEGWNMERVPILEGISFILGNP